MRKRGFLTLVAAFMILDVSVAMAQNSENAVAAKNSLKQITTSMPSGAPIRMYALDIDRNWVTSTTHLKGSVEVDIRETVKAGNRFMVVRADEATYNEKTGQLTPSGNVRMIEEFR